MIEKVTTLLSQMPPNWLKRVSTKSASTGTPDAELRKLLGEPLPKAVDPRELPRDLAALFATYGMLQKIKKKLEWISQRKGKKIIPAKNTIACVDAEDNIYMGIDFLEEFKDEEDLIAGIMAHEWGHMLSELAPGTDLSHLSWDQLFEIRREEEAAADAFAGKAMYVLGYSVEDMISYLTNVEAHEKKLKSLKYHPVETRAAIIRAAFKKQVEAADQIDKFFGSGVVNPSKSKLIAVA